MPKSPNQKLKLLYLRDMLLKESDDSHGLSMQQIITKLAEKGVSAERKSVYDDIESLRAYGMDIVARRGTSASTTTFAHSIKHHVCTVSVSMPLCSAGMTCWVQLQVMGRSDRIV
jgi:Fe2+ or Zn2+ uptake regulation protein